MVDALTELQGADTAAHSNDELLRQIDESGPCAARWRSRAPWLFRKVHIREQVVGKPETCRMEYLFHLILTRDSWMHRADIAGELRRQLVITRDQDGHSVADAVA